MIYPHNEIMSFVLYFLIQLIHTIRNQRYCWVLKKKKVFVILQTRTEKHAYKSIWLQNLEVALKGMRIGLMFRLLLSLCDFKVIYEVFW